MTVTADLIVMLGAFAGGFVSGLAGFGTGLVALGIWLHAVPPVAAAMLAAFCSVVAQCQTIPQVWRAIDFSRAIPMILAGAVGVPIGVALLAHVDPQSFRLGVGILLIVFSAIMLAARSQVAFEWGGRPADAVVGLGGGILGGLAGISGPLPTIWATLRGWSKDRRRGVFQLYNLTILGLSFLTYLVGGLVTRENGMVLVWALPGTLCGAWLGSAAYRRLSDKGFNTVVLVVLGLSGVGLIWPFVIR